MIRQHPINVIRAEHLGMCFGVRDAIELAFRHAEAAPLTILGDLVHNDDVLAALQVQGDCDRRSAGARDDADGDGDRARRIRTGDGQRRARSAWRSSRRPVRW